ncbi:class F sortase [Microtetraspora sp. NBRC 13810]|uniref:class F sortase n=1 Tax=Microtetraspora sp. NBRC 13810 TaxID=3030990 RepID=UPI0024A421A5|nr:class F sortase [Microtetraspora sp. NBRC 13810]GLW12721.1 class F sortase [Microtetraspora sp. NBRC 13810]
MPTLAEVVLKAAGLLFMAAGVAVAVDAYVNRHYDPPPAPPAGPLPAAHDRAVPARAVMRRSVPVRVEIPAIAVRAPVQSVGTRWDGSLAVPSTHDAHVTGWYDRGASPGERGPAVLLGHVDGDSGPAVFHRLGDLRHGDRVRVTRADGSVAVFTVRGVRAYAKAAFPAREVYGPTRAPALRLVTCGGRYDRSQGEYLDNVVAFADFHRSVPGGDA